ncbi:MAG TPA: hypothetical protein VMR21_02050, partial [Vicinamibacteria bacterium]|nr:hypothetical protein [Vicinamibacteria bacterium]
MRRAVLVVAALVILALGANHSLLETQSPEPPSPPPSGASPQIPPHEQMRMSMPEVIAIDLASLPDGGAEA